MPMNFLTKIFLDGKGVAPCGCGMGGCRRVPLDPRSGGGWAQGDAYNQPTFEKSTNSRHKLSQWRLAEMLLRSGKIGKKCVRDQESPLPPRAKTPSPLRLPQELLPERH
jgi:hypothetical protein